MDTREPVRIGYIPSAAHSILPVLVDAARNAPQRIALQSREMISIEFLEALDHGLIDAAIGRPLELPSSVQGLAEMTDPYCLAVYTSHPLATREGPLPLKLAAQEDLVSFSRLQSATYFERVIALCIGARFSPRIRHEAGGFGNALQMVALGLGVCSSQQVLPFQPKEFKGGADLLFASLGHVAYPATNGYPPGGIRSGQSAV